MQKLNLDWIEPLEFAAKIVANYDGSSLAFLYSGLNLETKNSTSQIALFAEEKICCDDFFAAKNIIENSNKKWFGYFSYEVGAQFENLPPSKESFVSLPKIWLVNFALNLEFDHENKELTAFFTDEEKLQIIKKWLSSTKKITNHKPQISQIFSNFTDASYINAINKIKDQIEAGDFYQTNLTRKFFGEFKTTPQIEENFSLFLQLAKSSPANFSAFLKLDENYIISSSPELFLQVKNGQVLSRPIKGTAPRHHDLKQDKKNKSQLKNSSKERAENLMIVDLVRNDLARICKAGSVKVKKLFTISSYKHIFHMSSEIYGKIAANFSALDVLQTCFPPGSMTGAPKIKAMEIAATFEQIERGIYSGTIGCFSAHEINTSVVIRTLIISDKKFEFQSGGAITFDSDANAELAEIFSKAKGIAELLNLSPSLQV